MNALPKYVVSGTLGEADLVWNTTLLPGDKAVARLRELRDTPGGNLLVMGSPSLARTLLAEDLADELRLMVMPVLLGGGKWIFPASGAWPAPSNWSPRSPARASTSAPTAARKPADPTTTERPDRTIPVGALRSEGFPSPCHT
ncbi:hypothetical protein STANM309S_00557 [Streptomyces tanashiensis]